MKLLLVLALSTLLLPAQSVAGLWVGTAQSGNTTAPLHLVITGAGPYLQARFINGPQRSRLYRGSFQDGTLQLHFADYANEITAHIEDGVLTGTFGGHAHTESVRLVRVPDIQGDWRIAVHGRKGETEWRMHVFQSGLDVRAVILRIDGDTGMLYGRFQDGEFSLSRFTADGPHTLVLRLLPDGQLQVGSHLAHRAAADPSPVPAVDNPLQHTRMKNPAQPLRFRFPALDGHLVSNTDARFRGKVLIVTVGGSWCPNCHDEAPFLESLYRKYHAQGLDIVSLSFEEQSQLADPTRLRAFMRDYGITYPVLLAGTPDQLAQALPQVADLNCWPTMFFIGRDGLVQRVHAGFAGPATGAAHTELVNDTDAFVRRLLAAKDRP